ncbi:DEAD-box ATP-dependent RNA helicase 21 [Dendrobium catenatum]|uniref:DEAD-box ATP-dependent RNA helicase 21 n=1 Tax=Dendrobium catenatum TaxID=906689 RepID=A0A2I0W158_9ASPA|nr:DEAD-box ATP-dependent RNA helicase 21 [Dendrobium catenatum]
MHQQNAVLELTEKSHPNGFSDPPCDFNMLPINVTSAPSLTPTGSPIISSSFLPSWSPSKNAERYASSCKEPKVHSLQSIRSSDSHSGDVIPCWIGSGIQNEEEEFSILIEHVVPISPKYSPDTLKKSSRNHRPHQFWGNSDNDDGEPSRPLKLVIIEKAKHWTEKTLKDMIERDWRVFHENCKIFYKEFCIHLLMCKWSESKLNTKLLKEVEKVGYKKSSPIQMEAIPLGLQERDLLDLSSNKLTDNLSPDLCFSNKLQTLSALRNFLFGPIPESLGVHSGMGNFKRSSFRGDIRLLLYPDMHVERTIQSTVTEMHNQAIRVHTQYYDPPFSQPSTSSFHARQLGIWNIITRRRKPKQEAHLHATSSRGHEMTCPIPMLAVSIPKPIVFTAEKSQQRDNIFNNSLNLSKKDLECLMVLYRKNNSNWSLSPLL